jgi:hypothetical protein
MRGRGFGGWVPLRFFEGKNFDGSARTTEGYKNVSNNHEVMPEKGHNDDPPYPTGEIAHLNTNSQRYRERYDQIRWESANPQSGS